MTPQLKQNTSDFLQKMRLDRFDCAQSATTKRAKRHDSNRFNIKHLPQIGEVFFIVTHALARRV